MGPAGDKAAGRGSRLRRAPDWHTIRVMQKRRQSEPPEAAAPAAFPATRWSLVLAARRDDTAARLPALDELLTLYGPALKRFAITGLRVAPDEADDLCQEFMARKILAQQLLGRADRARGRFRSFLLKCFSNHVRSEWRRRAARKRGPDQAAPLAERTERLADARAIRRAFDVEWARALLDTALRRMAAECAARGRADVWQLFEKRILAPAFSNAAPPPYDELVRELNLQSPSQAANLLVTAKRMFGRILHDTVAETVARAEDVPGEINALKKNLGGMDAGF